MTKKIKLGIIFGGKSLEHEVSLLSAASVIRATDKEKYEIIKTQTSFNIIIYHHLLNVIEHLHHISEELF